MMRTVLFWGLFPFVLPQAILLRKNAPGFFEAGGPKEGYVGAGRNFNLIAIGESIIAGVGARNPSNAP